MGYISNVALHAKGKKENYIKAQEDYFKRLEESSVTIWDIEGHSFMRSGTLHNNKENYVNAGTQIWATLMFYPTEDNYMKGSFFYEDIKWLGYYYHQCKIMLKVLTAYDYSWYYVHCGQVSNDVSICSNEEELGADFDCDVLASYTIEYSYEESWPRLREVKKDVDKK